MKNRSLALRKLFETEKLDAYIVANPINILYFTSFMGGARLLIPKDGENILYVHGVNYEASTVMAEHCAVELVKRSEDLDQKTIDDVKSFNIRQVGFDTLEASTYLKLKRRLNGVRLKPKGKLVWNLRKVKDEIEIQCMRKAAELADEGIKVAFETLVPGLKEYELAAEMEYAMRRLGSEGVAFDTIVASGICSAFPHGGCTDRKIQRGDLVVLDLGSTYKHYRIDITRTVVTGKPSDKQVKIYEIVKKAQENAFQSIHEGVKASDADIAARKIIEDQGYGEHFVHGLGHGVGLEVHEPPTLNPESKDILQAENVVTVEPGIYVIDFGGVRIEDTVLVQKERAERLTKASYELATNR